MLQRESRLRARLKGFPIALWKPSVATTGVDFFRSRGNRACGREGYSAFIVKVNV